MLRRPPQNKCDMQIKEVKVSELQRHPLHEELNRERTTDELRARAESITKHGRQKPLAIKMEEPDTFWQTEKIKAKV